MALFDKPEYKNISEIEDGTPFILLQTATREVDTKFGRRTAFDLRIQLSGDEEPEWYSGFAAGVLRQVQQSDPSDFPTWAKLNTSEGKGGRSGTRYFEPLLDDEGNPVPFQEGDDIPF